MTEYSIDITELAIQELDGAADYIENVLMNAKAANDLIDEFEAKVSELATFPEKYQLANDDFLAALGIMYIVIRNYIALYTIDKEAEAVHVLRFMYSKSSWMTILKGGILS